MNMLAELRSIPDLVLATDVPMAEHTSFGIGGPADILLTPHTLTALAQATRVIYAAGRRPRIIGNGTNLLVLDGGIRGVVVKVANGLSRVEVEGDMLVAESGARLASLCRTCADHGLGGLEWAAGIPGTLGGALMMNAGALEGEIGKLAEWVRVIRPDGEFERLPRQRLSFDYRSSCFQGMEGAIAQAGLRLQPSDSAAVRERICQVLEERCLKQPVAWPSAGSVFKRPNGDYAGRLLEEAGAKGMRVGDAVVSAKHANFIVNEGNATAEDVLSLIRQVQTKVKQAFDVDLATEVCVIGEPLTPSPSPASGA
jgi:UDP-N-acetylmuramate dehydrogenase